MAKYFLATILFLFGLVLIAPAASAQVNFSDDTKILLEGYDPDIELWISAGSSVQKMTVYPTYLEFDLIDGSSVTITSYDRYILTADPLIRLGTCEGTKYYITLPSVTTQTVKVTPGKVCEVGAGAVVTAPVTATGLVIATAVGGKTTVTTDEGTKASVELPANAVSKATNIKIAPVTKATVTVTAPVPLGKGIPGSYVFNYTAVSEGVAVTTFARTITLTFTYTEAQVVNLNQASLKAYYWDADAAKWKVLPSTVDTVAKKVTATTDHFTYFAIMGDVVEKPITEMTIEELKAKIAEITALIAQLQVRLAELLVPVIEGVPAEFNLQTNLKYGMVSDDVKYLQIVLNSDPETRLAEIGVGSPGRETNYFGPLTKAAVIKFQEKYTSEILAPWELTVGTGFVGKTTRAKLNQLYGE